MKILYLLPVFACTILLRAEERPRTISIEDARHLIFEALTKEAQQLPGLDIAPPKKAQTGVRCLTFEVLWKNPGIGSDHVDFFTVDIQTACLWRGVVCEPVVSPIVARVQRDLRKRLGLPEKAYRNAMRHPCCE